MKKNTLFFFLFCLLIAGGLLLFSRDFFLRFASNNKLIAGFIKFFILASIGDLISGYIVHRKFYIADYFILRMLIWGIIGVWITLMFPLYSSGVTTLFELGLLPFEHNVTHAFMTSVLMNLTFGAVMMLIHFMTDGYLDYRKQGMRFKEVLKKLDFSSFIYRTWFLIIPIYWVPMHTITFLLPSAYRVLFAAVLGITLGFILGITKRVVVDETK